MKNIIHTVGRRKTAIARAYMQEGEGKVTINNKDIAAYFCTDSLKYAVNQPFLATSTVGKYDLKVNLIGGGITGQAEALRLAISRALCKIDEETYRPLLKAQGLLTRDAREVERKKPGQPGARRRFQFSKR